MSDTYDGLSACERKEALRREEESIKLLLLLMNVKQKNTENIRAYSRSAAAEILFVIVAVTTPTAPLARTTLRQLRCRVFVLKSCYWKERMRLVFAGDSDGEHEAQTPSARRGQKSSERQRSYVRNCRPRQTIV